MHHTIDWAEKPGGAGILEGGKRRFSLVREFRALGKRNGDNTRVVRDVEKAEQGDEVFPSTPRENLLDRRVDVDGSRGDCLGTPLS